MRRRKPRNITTIPTTSMGDIAFLLIIFFMVCSNFAKEASIELTPPRAEDLKQIEESHVSVAIDKDNVVYVQGLRVNDPEQVEWSVRALVQDRQTEKGRTVMFKCHDNVDRSVFEPVLDAIAKGGGIIAALGQKRAPGEN